MEALPERVFREAVELIAELADDPFPSGSLELRGASGWYRIAFGDDRYRIVYRVSEARRRILIMREEQGDYL